MLDRRPPRNIMEARENVVSFCKSGHFTEATQAFERLCGMIKFSSCNVSGTQDPSTPVKINYTDIQIDNFQKSISSLIRYAPTIQESLDYACFCLSEVPEPLRDDLLEKSITINLIYLYKERGDKDGKKKALELIKTGVEYGYALPNVSARRKNQRLSFQDPSMVFIKIAAPILHSFGLAFSADKKSVISVR